MLNLTRDYTYVRVRVVGKRKKNDDGADAYTSATGLKPAEEYEHVDPLLLPHVRFVWTPFGQNMSMLTPCYCIMYDPFGLRLDRI